MNTETTETPKKKHNPFLKDGKVVRYPIEIREAIRERIKVLKMEGWTNKEIAGILNDEGFTTAAGGPLEEVHIKNQLMSIKKKAQKKLAKAREKASPVREVYNRKEAPQAENVCPPYVKETLLNDELDDKIKVHIIKGFYRI